MLHKKLFSVTPCFIVTATLILGFAPLSQATDSRPEPKIETKTKSTNAQPDTREPQQAAPAQPSSETEPVDGDETALA